MCGKSCYSTHIAYRPSRFVTIISDNQKGILELLCSLLKVLWIYNPWFIFTYKTTLIIRRSDMLVIFGSLHLLFGPMSNPSSNNNRIFNILINLNYGWIFNLVFLCFKGYISWASVDLLNNFVFFYKLIVCNPFLSTFTLRQLVTCVQTTWSVH